MNNIDDTLTEENVNVYIEIIKTGTRELSKHYRKCLETVKQQDKDIDKLLKSIENLEDQLISSRENLEDYKNRCYKALHLLYHNDVLDYRVFEERLENILKGEDN